MTDADKEVLFIEDGSIVTESDIVSASVVDNRGWRITVELTLDGGKRMLAATKKLRKHRDRLALFIDGTLVSAPIVLDNLESKISISGPGGWDEATATRMAGLLSGDDDSGDEDRKK